MSLLGHTLFFHFKLQCVSSLSGLDHPISESQPSIDPQPPSDDANDISGESVCMFMNIHLYVTPTKTISSDCLHVLKTEYEYNLSGWRSQR